MIKRLLLVLLLLFLSVWLGLLLHKDPGYILVAYRLWTIEMPLWTGIVLFLSAFLILYGLLRFLSATSSVRLRLRLWLSRRRKRKAQNLTSQGLLDLFEGEWGAAESSLLKAASGSDVPFVNYVAAAYAAQAQAPNERWPHYLQLAKQVLPEADIATDLIGAQLCLMQRQFEPAIASLEKVLALSPKQPQALHLLKDIYIQLCNWEKLNGLLPLLRKAKAVQVIEAKVLQQSIHEEKLRASHHDVEALKSYWQQIPQEYRYTVETLKVYVPALLSFNQGQDVEAILREGLQRNWVDEWVRWYGIALGANIQQQLATAESWLKKHPNNPILLVAAARLCLHNQLWGKARRYLEYSLQLKPQLEAYLLLADLLMQLNEKDKAFELYRKGLAAAVNLS